METDGGPRRALVIAAHPDDPEFGAGGTTALLTRDGWEVFYLVCTDGSKGTSDPAVDQRWLIETRREEQRAAARVLGVKECYFLDNVDGELAPNRELLEQIVRHIRMLRPHTVLTHCLDVVQRNAFINHSDHRATAQATCDAVYPAARDPLNFPQHLAEGLEPHKVRELLMWGAKDSNHEVEIGETLDQKIASLMEHHTQVGHREDFVRFVKERWRDESGRYLERFQRVVLLT